MERPVEMYPQPWRGEGVGERWGRGEVGGGGGGGGREEVCCRIAVSKVMQVIQVKYTDLWPQYPSPI